MNKYNTSVMREYAEKIDRECENFEKYRKQIVYIVDTLNQNWDDDQNRKYVQRFKSEADPSMEKLGSNIKQIANVLHQCAIKYGAAIDNGNTKFSL